MRQPDITTKVKQHDGALKRIATSLDAIDSRLESVEQKIDNISNHTLSGNTTRNLIAVMVVVKLLFEGGATINWDAISHAIKLLSGGF